MTIQTTVRKARFIGDGVNTTFPFAFKTFASTDLVLTQTSLAGVDSPVVSAVSINLNSDQELTPGGVVTYPTSGTPMAAGVVLTITSNLAATQQTDLTNAGGFFPKTVSDRFDYLTILIQQALAVLAGSLIVSASDPAPQLSLGTAANRANRYVTFDGAGNAIMAQSLPSGTLSAASIGSYTGPQTVAEAATGVAVPNPWYLIGDMRRYGLVANSFAAATTNTTILKTLFNPLITNGPQGSFAFPNVSGADVYYVNGVIPCRANVRIDANGSTISMGQSGSPVTGVAADSNSGIFMAASDFSFVNGNIVIWWATGVSTSSGNAFQLGFRGNDSARWPLNPVYDNVLAVKQGNFYINNVRITSTVTGVNVVSAGAVALCGGLTNVDIRNVYITGSGTGGMGIGIDYEFGWATVGTAGDPGQSSRQSSHMHNAHFTNIVMTNMDNVSASSFGILLTGAYNCTFNGIYIAGSSNAIVCNPGEAQYFRPWVGVDDVGSKHGFALRNIVIVGSSSAGITMEGRSKPTAGSTYLHQQWVALTTVVAGQTVVNGGNMYVTAAGGITGNTGGPAGTGAAIVEGSVTWSYVSLQTATDLIEFTLEDFAISTTSTGNAIVSYGRYAGVRNGLATGGGSPLVLSEETTRFDIDGCDFIGSNGAGIQADFTASAIWSPARLKKGTIKNCYIAGNSASSAGTFGGIQIKNFDGVTIENCRFGYETAHSFVQETTQGQAILISSTTAGANANMKIRGCRVGGSVGGVGFANNSASINQGNTVENCTFNAGGTNPVTTPISGAWITDLESATSVAIAGAGTITTNGVKTSRVNPAAAVTGVIMQAGSYSGQEITVFNEAIAANTITFAAVGTSRVADGVSSPIPGLVGRKFVWNVAQSLWYRAG